MNSTHSPSPFDEAFQLRAKELEALDESPEFKLVPRREWGDKGINNKTLLWQVPRTTAELLAFLVRVQQPKLVLELGTSGGYSGMWMAKELRQYGGVLHTIEFFEYRFNIAKETFAKTNLSSVVVQHQGKIADILATWSLPIDFLFIDAAKNFYLDHLLQAEPFLTSGALIVADNVLDKKLEGFIAHVENSPEYACVVLPIDNGLLLARKH
jgi:predicted O-methyltransferase YrrM